MLELFFQYLLYTFLGVASINIIYYLFFLRFAFAKSSRRDSRLTGEQSGKVKGVSHTTPKPPVSLIVCSKNEAENLKDNIPRWLDQAYPNFQLVLINDASIDETQDVIEQFAQEDPRITVVNVDNNEAFWGSKKYALTLGIKRAKHKILLFTDADCVPASRDWISGMASKFTQEKELVLGYGRYVKKKGSFLNVLIRFETVITALQYFGYAIFGRAYMGVGRNLAYTTDLFYEQKGFINHMQVPSGDDDLFVNEASTRKNTALSFHPDAFTLSTAKKTFKEWRTQKRRHINVAGLYKRIDRIKLGMFYISQFLFVVFAIALLILQYQWKIVVVLIAVRYIISWLVVGQVARKLKENDVAFLYPILELFLIIFQLSIFISNLIAKPSRWK